MWGSLIMLKQYSHSQNHSSIYEVERFFLCRSFSKALLGCYIRLWNLTSLSSHEQVVDSKLVGGITSNGAPIQYDAKNRLILSFIPCRPHICSHQDCICSRLLVLMAQTLFELGRAEEFFPLVLRFFPSTDVPFDVVRATVQLLCYTENYRDCSDFVSTALDSGKFEEEQKRFLFRLLCVEVLPHLKGDAFAIETALNDHTFDEGFCKLLVEEIERKARKSQEEESQAELEHEELEKRVAKEHKKQAQQEQPAAPIVPRKEQNILARNGLVLPLLVGVPSFVLLIALWRSKRMQQAFRAWMLNPVKDFFSLAFSTK